MFPSELSTCIVLDGYAEKYPLKTIYISGGSRETMNRYNITLYFEKKVEVESFMNFYINTINKNNPFSISLPLSHDLSTLTVKNVRIINEIEITPLNVGYQRQVAIELLEV